MAKFFDKFKQIKNKNTETPREEEKIREFYYDFDELIGVVEDQSEADEKGDREAVNQGAVGDGEEVGTAAEGDFAVASHEIGASAEIDDFFAEADMDDGTEPKRSNGFAEKMKALKERINAKLTGDIDTWDSELANSADRKMNYGSEMEATVGVGGGEEQAAVGDNDNMDCDRSGIAKELREEVYQREAPKGEISQTGTSKEEQPVLETSTDEVGLIDRQSKGYLKAKKAIDKILPKRKGTKRVKRSTENKFTQKLSAAGHVIREKEEALAHNMVRTINKIDKKNERIAKKVKAAAGQGAKHLHLAREWADTNKRRILKTCAGIIICALALITVYNTFTAFEYAYNGRTLGVVQEQEDVLRLVELVNKNLSKEHNAEIAIDKDRDITFKRVFAINREVDNMEQVLKRLSYMQDMQVKGYAIVIAGQQTAIVDSEEKAQEILDSVMAAFTVVSDTVEYEKVGFAETVEIEQIDTKLSRFNDKDEVLMKILTGAEKQDVYYVQAGDTFNGIAAKHGISSADLRASNPTVIPEKLKISQEIILNVPTPLLTVQTIEVATYIEPLPYETTYQDNASIYIGENTTKVKGVNGERSVTARITKNNGIEVAKTELNAEIIKEPVTAVVLRGTKALPPKQGTGTFVYPVSGAKLTSKFGSRWGRMHYGIDLACSTGTKIRASDGGTVTFAGYSGSYGYVVKINHGGGFVTVYAHCSKMFVKVGEKVYQGQHIANVGSTGRSTGPHCHFEVQYLGVQKNPLNYL